jgi:oligopeptide/dipeptide ABC transporter ATP-binding protein
MTDVTPLLEVNNLVVEFDSSSGPVKAVDGVTFMVFPDEVFCLVGESGSGKSVTMLAVMGLLPPNARITSGEILFKGRDIRSMPRKELNQIRGKELAMVFQDPMTSLNPVRRVGTQIAEMVKLHRKDLSKSEVNTRVIELLKGVGVKDAEERAKAYPHQWSGGMRQRAMIAMAMAHSPSLLVADEPTTALDVTIQAQVMDVLSDVRAKTSASMIMITHDMGLVAEVADRVVVMYSGRMVESGTVFDVFDHPKHPYTVGLLASVLQNGPINRRAYAIPGSPPSPQDRPSGCNFNPRCGLSHGRQICRTDEPVLIPLGPTQSSACHFADEVAEWIATEEELKTIKEAVA